MNYQQFAYVYDYLMADAPYDQWLDYVTSQIKRGEHHNHIQVLDLACGTGELTIMLAKAGFQVTGVDLSADMLFVAHEKAKKHKLEIPFFQQNMTELQDLGLFDVVTVFCDSLNYLPTLNDVENSFKSIYSHLKVGGLLLFDVHSPHKINQIFNHATFADADEEVSYIWECFPGEYPHSVEHELTFYIVNSSGTYDRYDEFHKQRTYEINQYKDLLHKTGFKWVSTTADFTNEPPTETSERIFFACKK